MIELKKVSQLQPTEIRDYIRELKQAVDDSYAEISELLFYIYNDRLFSQWGFETFASYVENELGMKIRKAQYLLSIYYWFKVELSDEDVWNKIKPLGWSYAKELVGVVNKDNVDEWINKAKSMSVMDLATETRRHILVSSGRGVEADRIPDKHRVTLTMTQDMYNNFVLATDKLKKKMNTDNVSYIVDMIITQFLATELDESGVLFDVILRSLEKYYNLKVVAIKDANIVYGKDFVEDIVFKEV
jgi:hypothetical protein